MLGFEFCGCCASRQAHTWSGDVTRAGETTPEVRMKMTYLTYGQWLTGWKAENEGWVFEKPVNRKGPRWIADSDFRSRY